MTKQRRFLTPVDVAEELAVSQSQMYAILKSGELPAIQVGGRGQWRIERARLEEYIARMYEQAEKQRTKLKLEDLPAE
ncbi:helix-turn-helix domain-containing protein [Vibrio cholerae]|nr:helix-turn-helix domain-containing protein [Vibrio cholerae]